MHITSGAIFVFPVPAALCNAVSYSCRVQAFML